MNDTPNLFPAKKDGKSGYINSAGQIVIDFHFDFFGCRGFSEGLAGVLVNGKAGYIDSKGYFKIQPKFNLAMPFSEGLAYVELDNKYGYIDKSGEFVVKCLFRSYSATHFGVHSATFQVQF